MPRAVVCVKNGDPLLPLGAGVLALEPNLQLPDLKKGHIRIAIAAASINYADPLQVKGDYQVKPRMPFVPGHESSGTVLSVGPGVTQFKPGDKVVAVSSGGMFAEECVVHQSAVWHVPEGVELLSVAAVPVTYGTADLALRHRCNLQSGQTVLVLGAGGGVGVAAVQLAKVAGARVIAVTQGADKVKFVQSQGADVVLDLASVSKDSPLHRQVKAHAPKGVHVVLDNVGGPYLAEALKTLCWGAHVVVIGFAAGGIPKIPANILLVKNTTVHGLFWGSYLQQNPQVVRESMNSIMALLQSGALKPAVSHRFPLEQLPQAFDTLFKRKMMGKIIIVNTPQSKM